MNRLGNREIFRVAGPILLSLLFQQMIGLTDTAFLGRVGEVELGAAALGSVWFLAVYMLGFGFSVGVQILIARCNGEGHHSEIGRIFYSGIAFQLLLACIVFALSRLLSPLLLPRMIRSPEVCAATASYLEYRSYGFFFVYLAVMFRAFYVGITRTHILTFNSVVMVLANAVLNYALIFGKFGFPAMGIAGAAIASSAAELFSVLFYCIYTRCRVDLHKYRLEKIFTFDFAVLRRVLNLSVWTMLQSFVSVSVWFFFFIAVEHLGERPLAVINLVRNVSALVFIFTNAFATAASSLVSNLIGAGRTDEVMELGRRIAMLALVIVSPFLLFVALFPQTVLGVFTGNAELIAAAAGTLIVMAAIQPLQIVAGIWFNVVSGTGSTRTALFIEVGTLLVYLVSVWYIVLFRRLGTGWCWSTEFYYSFVMLAASLWYLKKARWQGRRI